VDANDSLEIVKICQFFLILLLYCMLICGFKYINSKLKVDFDLDTTFKPKPVARLDDLLLLLVQHWAREMMMMMMIIYDLADIMP
jgi:hypothetical protein